MRRRYGIQSCLRHRRQVVFAMCRRRRESLPRLKRRMEISLWMHSDEAPSHPLFPLPSNPRPKHSCWHQWRTFRECYCGFVFVWSAAHYRDRLSQRALRRQAKAGGVAMNLANRKRILALARLLDRAAAKLRKIAKDATPKRGPRKNSSLPNADLKAMSAARTAVPSAEESA